MTDEEHERLLGMIDALQHAIVEVATELPPQTRHAIASEIDMYGARANKDCPSPIRAEALRDTAWHIAKQLWPKNNP